MSKRDYLLRELYFLLINFFHPIKSINKDDLFNYNTPETLFTNK